MALELPMRRSDRLFRLLTEELKSRAVVPFWQRLRELRHGYLSQSVLLYKLNAENRHLFVSDYQASVKTPDINGVYRVLVKDKLLFDLMTQLFPALHIPTHGVVDRGKLLYGNCGASQDLVGYISDLLKDRERLVFKPVVGGGGAGIVFVERRGNAYALNQEVVSAAELAAWLGALENNLLTDFVTQAPELAHFFPHTTNTIRLLTMWDADGPFVASAVLRIGTRASIPVDNGLKGGIAAGIDLATGQVSKAVSFPRHTGQAIWYANHPDTGAQIEGVVIPRWQKLLSEMEEVCRRIPYLRYIGWDIVVTENGSKLIEGNHFPGLWPNQAHQPLLADPRVLRFYKSYGVV
ncbi:MAG: sugar-transfer associated ATP-grasp domain-containing protein [Hyphomonadaceae bacterium]